MYDVVGRIWSFIFGALALFLGTTMVYAQKQDVVVQNYVDSVVEEFVDTSRATGKITENNYETFIEGLDATQNVYDVNIIHYEEKLTPSTESEYETTYEAHDKADVIEGIYSDDGKGYQMSTGDFIRVSVKNTSPTLGRKLMGLFLGNGSEGGQIISTYGGYVGNESQQ